jgi:intein/homing endonuclease/glycosyltransferase involved in cell wall biosynthesis
MKILMYGETPLISTGSGNVSKRLVPMLLGMGHEVEIVAINHFENEMKNCTYPCKIHPSPTNDAFNLETLKSLIRHADYDLLFLYSDVGQLNKVTDLIRDVRQTREFKVIMYTCVDCDYLNAQTLACLTVADFPVMYSQHSKRVAQKYYPALNIQAIPHGCEPDIFYPLSEEERSEVRRKTFGIDDDFFLVVNVNRNQWRKDPGRSLMIFHEFHKTHPKSAIYMHMKMQDIGGSLPDMAQMIGMRLMNPEAEVIFTGPKFAEQEGVPRDTLNKVYNCADVVISTSTGEGWGLCLSPKTNVFTDHGLKQIQDISLRDKVYTDGGIFEKVLGIKSRQYSGNLYTIKTWKGNPIVASDNHPFFALGKGYVEASNLQVGDELVYPRLKASADTFIDIYSYLEGYLNVRQKAMLNLNDSEINIQSNFKGEERKVKRHIDLSNPDVSRLLGLYVAEGYANVHKGTITFSFHEDETDLMDFVENTFITHFCEDIVLRRDSKKDSKARQVSCSSSILAILFKKLFGERAREKKVDYSILPRVNAKQFIKGLLEGDGYVSEKEMAISTTSGELAYTVQLLCSQIGVSCSVTPSRMEYKIRISGKARNIFLELLGKDQHEINTKYSNEKCITTDDYIVYPIKQIDVEEVTDYELVDIEVANTHSFVAENCLVHNCTTEAMAARRPFVGPRNTSFVEIIGAEEERGYLADSGGGIDHLAIPYGISDNPRSLVHAKSMLEKLVHVYHNRDEAQGKADHARAWTLHHTWTHVEEEWQSLLARVNS